MNSFFGLIIVTLLASFAQVVAQSPATEKKTTVTTGDWQQVRGRIEKIEKELAELKEPEWAGVYEAGYYGVSGSLLYISPQSGFVFQPYTDVFPNDIEDKFDYGEAKITDGRVVLHSSIGNFTAFELLLVRWGGRRFLIPDGYMQHFINIINAGCDQFQTNEKVAELYFYVRRDDRRATLFGTPNLPAQFRHFILRTPITASITSVGGSTVENPFPDSKTYPWRWRHTEVKLNAGQVDGLWAGMALFTKDAKGEVVRVVVSDVGEHSAEAVVTMDVNSKMTEQALPGVGWTLTSRLNKSQYNSFCW